MKIAPRVTLAQLIVKAEKQRRRRWKISRHDREFIVTVVVFSLSLFYFLAHRPLFATPPRNCWRNSCLPAITPSFKDVIYVKRVSYIESGLVCYVPIKLIR